MTGIRGFESGLEVRRFGGKAASLSDAILAGLPVPPGFGLDVAAASRIAGGDATLSATLHQHAATLGGPLAVRSSAIGEDSGAASFAGQHRTVLGVVGATALEAAVRDVVASGHASKAYRGTMGLDGQAEVAVVVQRMIDAELAGVAFTRHPVTGARELIVEFCCGLGEMLVSGRASPARLRFASDGVLIEQQDGHQDVELRLRADGHAEERARNAPAISASLLPPAARTALRDVAARAEGIAGEGRDLEWAWADGRLWLLQSRPITRAGDEDAALQALVQSRNVLHGDCGTTTLWSRVNVGEALPGTLRPLTAEFHLDSIEVSPQRAFQRLGVLRPGPATRPVVAHESPSRFLCGRLWVNVDYMRGVADRIPGTSGNALEEAMLGRVRPGVTSTPRRDRIAPIALAMVRLIAGMPDRLDALHTETHRWWQATTRAMRHADLATAIDAFDEACTHYADVIDDQCLIATLAAGFWEPVAKIVRRIGTEDDLLQLTAGYGTVLEARMLERLWAVSRGTESLDSFLDDYGYMAASGGELVNPSWREHREALERIVAQTAARPDAEHPARRQADSRARFEATRARLLASASPVTAIGLRLALRLAARMLPIREVGKACMTMGQDVGRACARRIGVLLAQRGDLDDAGDVYFLSRDELRAAKKSRCDLRPRVAERRRLHAFYDALALPEFCTGAEIQALLARGLDPQATSAGDMVAASAGAVHGIGVSRGHYTGVARVVHDPNAANALQPGDILVCTITDPGWTALFSVAGALVVDVGGMLSHGAIIARELGIPAVVNTRDGTKRIPDGARIAVDGAAGTVTILEGEPA
ncbi:MAG TPA: PEP/pyruvate-binding domain-containing protein [Nevskiaceae bacterium]|nr:PEP/pyruvate-binding domain-containing protein [Nevskiaceae bacterium]